MKDTKRTSGISRNPDPINQRVTFTQWLADDEGKAKVTVDTYTFDYAELGELNAEATAHGWNQKLGDQAAKDAGTDISAKFKAIRDEGERVVKDRTWNAKRAAGAKKVLTDEEIERLFAELQQRKANATGTTEG